MGSNSSLALALLAARRKYPDARARRWLPGRSTSSVACRARTLDRSGLFHRTPLKERSMRYCMTQLRNINLVRMAQGGLALNLSTLRRLISPAAWDDRDEAPQIGRPQPSTGRKLLEELVDGLISASPEMQLDDAPALQMALTNHGRLQANSNGSARRWPRPS